MKETDVTTQEVLQAEKEWLEAHRQVNVAAIDRLMHRDYTIIKPDGSVVGKAAALASYGSGTRQWEFAHSDQLKVRIYGRTAVVIGRWRAKGVNDGEAFDYAARYTSVWVKENGRWQMVSDQSTPIS